MAICYSTAALNSHSHSEPPIQQASVSMFELLSFYEPCDSLVISACKNLGTRDCQAFSQFLKQVSIGTFNQLAPSSIQSVSKHQTTPPTDHFTVQSRDEASGRTRELLQLLHQGLPDVWQSAVIVTAQLCVVRQTPQPPWFVDTCFQPIFSSFHHPHFHHSH